MISHRIGRTSPVPPPEVKVLERNMSLPLWKEDAGGRPFLKRDPVTP